MHGIEYIAKNDKVFGILLKQNFSSEKKYNFITPNEYTIQLGSNFYKAGEKIRNHKHVPRDFKVDRLQEFIVINRGKCKIFMFDDDDQLICERIMEAGDSILLTAGGHGFEVLEDLNIVEIKQGPFDPNIQEKIFF
jgi:hypothetical protein